MWPAGITTKTVTAGPAYILEDGTSLAVFAEFKASRSLTWHGSPLITSQKSFHPDSTVEISFDLPVCDLVGMRDADGALIVLQNGQVTHSWTILLTFFDPVSKQVYETRKRGPFTILSNDPDRIDLDDLVIGSSPVDGEAVRLIPGPANTISIGTVVEGDIAAAGLQGIAPQQILDLTIPKAKTISDADLAAKYGFWPILSNTPPASPTIYNVPVVWFDPNEQLVPIPVNPVPPLWDDSAGTIKVPSGLLGLEYQWVSGGGGFGGTLDPGVAVPTSGSYPRSVNVQAHAKPGYVLASGVSPFKHDFADPSGITTMFSDGFSGSSGPITNRVVDNALGGSLAQAISSSTFTLDGSGHAVATGPTGNLSLDTRLANVQNVEIAVDITSLGAIPGNYFTPFFTISFISYQPSYANFLYQFSSYTPGTIDSNPTIKTTTTTGGSADLVATGPKPAITSGLWKFRFYVNTVTITAPDGSVQNVDISDPSLVRLTNVGEKNIQINANNNSGLSINSIKVSKVGF